MACLSLIIAVAAVAGDARVVATTVVITSFGKSVHCVITFLAAAAAVNI